MFFLAILTDAFLFLYPLLAQSGHGAAIGTYVKLSIAVNRPRTTCDGRGGSGQSVKEQRTTRPQTRKGHTTHVSGFDFPGFIVIDDKGHDFFKDSNLR